MARWDLVAQAVRTEAVGMAVTTMQAQVAQRRAGRARFDNTGTSGSHRAAVERNRIRSPSRRVGGR